MVLEKIKFEKYPKPVLEPKKDSWWERYATYNPAAAVKKEDKYEKVFLIYRAEHARENYVSKLGLASSSDGIDFKREKAEPILEPCDSAECRGLEDPRIVKVNGTYILTFSPWDGKATRIALATSNDLKNWEREGLLFGGRERIKHGCICPEKIQGRYLMYFRDNNQHIALASSENMLDWKIENDSVVTARDFGAFDSRTVSPASTPIVTDNHILLFYIGSDKVHPDESPLSDDFYNYALGAVLFKKENPEKVIERTEIPLLVPEFSWERLGKVNNVIYPTGLVKFKGKHLLYYGAADNVVGVAVARDIEEIIESG